MPEVPPAPEVVLYRCGCSHCDMAEEELRRQAARHGAAFEVRRVEKEGVGQLAGWATPVVYVNGVEISHYTMSAKAWREALAATLERKRLRGEVVDLRCYEDSGARGPEHQECAEHCINEIKLPMGLLTADGDLYQVVAGRGTAGAHEGLKQLIGRQVEITGDLFHWKGRSTLIVRDVS
ncbi:MAG: glutaredoxin [Elusimicrobia bacterium]|nr:glutaredoxin [Elusimicrobiota bacterium]